MREKVFTGTQKPNSLKKGNFIHPQDNTIMTSNIDGFQLPGIIDIHFHGSFGWDFAFGDVEKLNEMLDKTLQQGITGIVPTLITCSEEQRLKALKDIAQLVKTRKKPPIIHGIYLEGPFLAAEKRGSHPATELLIPDFAKFLKWQEAAEGLVKIITIAPELPGAIEFIEKASAEGIICALGHSNADWETTTKAIEAGACHVTHLFNAMPSFHHREPNMLSCIMSSKNLSIELIADSIHVSNEILKLSYSIFENDKIILTSDCVATTGLPDGRHQFYNRELIKYENSCRLEDGNLFGGSATLVESLKKLGNGGGIAWGQLGTSVWRNPCSVLAINPPETEVFFDTDFRWLATRSGGEWFWSEKNE
ncbi:MAG: N-acetylglucosamine-6-phosphate deacetylase [Candidatus Rifleibacteriota bacterium]